MAQTELENWNKQALRRSLLKTRQSLSVAEWQAKSSQLGDRLQASSLFTQAQTILAYFSIRQEPDLSPLFTLPKTWGFPRCVGKTLSWHCWSPNGSLPLQVGVYGIREPHPDAPLLVASQVDLLLVPAVACDRRGYRLGYGGGFYDRLLSAPEWRQKPAIGIVFESARLPVLPVDPWDQPLTGIGTEAGIFMADT